MGIQISVDTNTHTCPAMGGKGRDSSSGVSLHTHRPLRPVPTATARWVLLPQLNEMLLHRNPTSSTKGPNCHYPYTHLSRVPHEFPRTIPLIASSLGLRGSCLHHSPHCNNPSGSREYSRYDEADSPVPIAKTFPLWSLHPHRKPGMSGGSSERRRLATSGKQREAP